MRPGGPYGWLMADAHRALTGIRGGGFGPLRWLAETTSTNSLLVAEARRGARHGAVIVADHQSAGRGRLGRAWTSEPGSSVAVSVLLRPERSSFPVGLVGIAVANSAWEACRALGAEVSLKWPNDLMAGPAGLSKLGGILAEVVERPGRSVVAGLGVNLRDPLPPEMEPIATNVQRLTGTPPSPADFVSAYLAALHDHYAALCTSSGKSAELHLYRERCATLGQPVRIELPGRVVEAVARDLTERGELLAETTSGEVTVVTAGDVVHLRAVRAG